MVATPSSTKPWLLIDVSNMAHRAMYTTGDLSYAGDSTGVLFGVFRDVIQFGELFATDQIAFCFDGGIDKRLEVYPEYKAGRRAKRQEMDEGEKDVRRELRRQVYRLRTHLLLRAGFRNAFWQEGYEADDVIANLCERYRKSEFIIVSADQDLWQCLDRGRVTCWNPITTRAVTQESFEAEFGVAPSMWAHVKAIAGCPGDGVPGVKGVGEKTAAKYLAGRLKAESKAFQSIVESTEMIDRNLELVRLPFPGCGPFHLFEDDPGSRSWDDVMEGLGMKSLVGRR